MSGGSDGLTLGVGRKEALTFALAFVLLASLLAVPSSSLWPDLRASPGASSPSSSCGCPRIASVTVWSPSAEGPSFTLYGDARDGWGPTNTTITNPGPSLEVFKGDIVSVTLIGNDILPHNWFVDYNDNRVVDAGEPSSPDFQGVGDAVVWNFTADRPGSYTYRCRYHPTTMTGSIEVRATGRPKAFILYGNALAGWGVNNTTITRPGPALVVDQGDNVTMTLVGNDPLAHNWFVDYNGNSVPDPGEPSSPDFEGVGDTIVWNFTANRPGAFTYRCRYHPGAMTGNITVVGTGPPPPDGGVTVPLIPAIMIGTIVVVLLAAAVVQIRAMRARHPKG